MPATWYPSPSIGLCGIEIRFLWAPMLAGIDPSIGLCGIEMAGGNDIGAAGLRPSIGLCGIEMPLPRTLWARAWRAFNRTVWN